jgi:hypothetical protein
VDLDPALAPDPAISIIDLQDTNKKQFFLSFSVFYFLNVHLHYFSKSNKEVKTVGIKVFLSILEGSGS